MRKCSASCLRLYYSVYCVRYQTPKTILICVFFKYLTRDWYCKLKALLYLTNVIKGKVRVCVCITISVKPVSKEGAIKDRNPLSLVHLRLNSNLILQCIRAMRVIVDRTQTLLIHNWVLELLELFFYFFSF